MLAADEKLLPGDVILYELAVTYESAGREDDAQSQYQRIIEEYPQSAYRAAAQQRVAAVVGTDGIPGAAIGS